MLCMHYLQLRHGSNLCQGLAFVVLELSALLPMLIWRWPSTSLLLRVKPCSSATSCRMAL